METAIVLTGGGIKSAVSAAQIAPDFNLILVHFRLGDPGDEREAEAAAAVASSFAHARSVSIEVDLESQYAQDRLTASPKKGSQAATGERGERPARSEIREARSAFARGRLPLILSLGTQAALRFGAGKLITGLCGAHVAKRLGTSAASGDLDAMRELIHAFNLFLDSCLTTRDAVRVEAPLLELTYGQIITLGKRWEVPLDRAWTCVGPGPRPCGECEPCSARAAAFIEAVQIDPLVKPTPV